MLEGSVWAASAISMVLSRFWESLEECREAGEVASGEATGLRLPGLGLGGVDSPGASEGDSV